MSDYYLLDENKQPYKVELLEWARWLENNKKNMHVRFNTIKKFNVDISTVFLGLDHGYPRWSGHTKSYKPVLFETMIFWPSNEELDQYQERYSTWKEALEGHRKAVRMVIDKIRIK